MALSYSTTQSSHSPRLSLCPRSLTPSVFVVGEGARLCVRLSSRCWEEMPNRFYQTRVQNGSRGAQPGRSSEARPEAESLVRDLGTLRVRNHGSDRPPPAPPDPSFSSTAERRAAQQPSSPLLRRSPPFLSLSPLITHSAAHLGSRGSAGAGREGGREGGGEEPGRHGV